MKHEYKIIHYYDVKRLIMQVGVKINKDIIKSAEKISKMFAEALNSEILFEKTYIFDNIYKNFTYMAILSTSHIVISSYFNKDYKVLDIDIAWCSGVDAKLSQIDKILKEVFGDKFSILSLKYLDYKGEELNIE